MLSRQFFKIILIILCGLALVYFAGPRSTRGTPCGPVNLPQDLDMYLAQSEKYPDIIPGTEKTIAWANPSKSKTPVAIVYLHGYSASRQEVAPLCEKLAVRWGANVYYTRLTGHGRNAETLVNAHVNDLLHDALEAIAIGRRLGDRVIVIGTSAGGALAAWLAEQPGNDDVMAYVLLSPAVGFKHPLAGLLLGPWAVQLARLVEGPEYGAVSANPLVERYWITHYPSRGVVTPAMLAQLVWRSVPERIHRPMLVFYSPQDQVVAPQAIEKFFRHVGTAVKEIVQVQRPDPPENHLLAGDIRAPQMTGHVADVIFSFISEIPGKM
ncbi:MAG: alpha/beta fold hydrolase [Candidatus Omnitrophota bacterium]